MSAKSGGSMSEHENREARIEAAAEAVAAHYDRADPSQPSKSDRCLAEDVVAAIDALERPVVERLSQENERLREALSGLRVVLGHWPPNADDLTTALVIANAVLVESNQPQETHDG